MMKSIVALLASVSAIELTHHHHHHRRPSLVQRRQEDPFYKETRDGANWFDMDDPHERLHGTQNEDFNTAYDPDVVDAPEDLPRVGNDHEALSNAKLSPNGYYDGFFHKDFEGNFAQRRSRHHHH